MPRDIFADVVIGEVVPRDTRLNPRCPACKTPDRKGRPPMFHPRHPFGSCEVFSDIHGVCGCTHEEEALSFSGEGMVEEGG